MRSVASLPVFPAVGDIDNCACSPDASAGASWPARTDNRLDSAMINSTNTVYALHLIHLYVFWLF